MDRDALTPSGVARRSTPWALPLFIVAGLAITFLWTNWAGTETHKNRYSSIVALTDGSGVAPFPYRRLYPDTIRVLVSAVPQGTWDMLVARILDAPRIRGVIVGRFKWERPEDYPVLIIGTLLIWVSAVGFMFAVRSVVRNQYELTPDGSTVFALLLGCALLGAGSDNHYQSYPYDFTTAWTFSLCIALILKRSRWFAPAFMLACYAKETSVLLIIAFLLVDNRWSVSRKVAFASFLGAAYLAIQYGIRHYVEAIPGVFWWPSRNARWLVRELFWDSWLWPFVAVGAWQCFRMRRDWPPELRRLTWLLPLLIVPAFFKGWIEERRQYLELYVVLGPLVVQWVDTVLGIRLLRPRLKPGG